MDIVITPGKYVVAVSGGVDSMALLHRLVQEPGLELVAAHFEHGIRADSDEDRKLVQTQAERYGLPFVFARGNLGAGASEATARTARYNFLEQVRAAQGAAAIITAHHQDDAIETALINMLRGTGPRGLAGLQSTDAVVRPLLTVPKIDIQMYARAHDITWREDSTNADERYLRNYLRRRVLPKMSVSQRGQLIKHIHNAAATRAAIERELAPHTSTLELDRAWFIALPYDVSTEAMAAWLRRWQLPFDRKAIHRLTVFAKTAAPGKRADITAKRELKASKNHITLTLRAARG
ncbi:MAG TPA: tRNA lysidine(34) synthetase TilS [Candidatus Saccharimonadales bacterium]|nr:tRNA lysidine(34) synthetase TilS [Candidatus Saccharimonadales bacterium]